MPLYVGDYLADTNHLGATEHGAYLMLLMAMWRNGPLPDDRAKLAKYARCTGRQWAAVEPAIMPLLTIEGGFVSQRRLMAERTKYEVVVNTKRISGAAGGRAKALKDKEAVVADAMRSPCQPEPELEREKETPSGQRKKAPPPASPPKGSRLPSDWRPSEIDGAYAASMGLTRPAIDLTAEKFRNYWLAKPGLAGLKLDWPATWRNWVLADLERRETKPAVVNLNEAYIRSNLG